MHAEAFNEPEMTNLLNQYSESMKAQLANYKTSMIADIKKLETLANQIKDDLNQENISLAIFTKSLGFDPPERILSKSFIDKSDEKSSYKSNMDDKSSYKSVSYDKDKRRYNDDRKYSSNDKNKQQDKGKSSNTHYQNQQNERRQTPPKSYEKGSNTRHPPKEMVSLQKKLPRSEDSDDDILF